MRIRVAGALALAAATVALYAPALGFDFVNYDDTLYVVENPNLRAGLSPASVWRAFAEPYETNWIPLTWLSLQLDHALHGLDPAGYHATNVALHAASAALLLLALGAMTGATAPSAFVAAVFAAHPLHVESVAWVSERKDTLSGLFFALMLLAYARHAARPSAGRLAAVAAALAAGLLAKPMLVTAPFVLLLLDVWPLRRWGSEPGARRRLLLEKLPLLALAAAAAAVTFVVQRETGAMSGDEQIPLGARVANALIACVVYLRQSIWPSGLAVFYPHPGAQVSAGSAAAAGALLVTLTGLAAWQRRRRPWLLVGWLWFLGMLVPVIGLVQVGLQAHADRYLYLPQTGLAVALAWGALDLAGASPARRRALAVAGAAAVAALAVASRAQLPHWRDTLALFGRAAAVTEDNYLAHHGLGTALLRDDRPAEAERHFREALRIKPRWAGAHMGLADALAARGEHEAALPSYRRALELAPRHVRARVQLGRALAALGRHDEAIEAYRRALRTAGKRDGALAHALLARSLDARGELARAIEHYERSLALRADAGEVHANLGAALLRAGRPAEAQAALERAAALGQRAPDLEIALAEAAQQRGDGARAVRHYRAALALDPASLEAANNLAWILATHPSGALRDAAEAVRLLEPAARSADGEPALLDTLAAAYAAAGRFEEAAATAARAAKRARARGALELAAGIEQRLALYRAGRPYRTPAAR